MKRPLVVITIGYIIGIVWGLYCNCSIAFLYVVVMLIGIIYKLIKHTKRELKLFSIKRYFRYIKLFFNKNAIIVIIISSIISNITISIQNKKYEKLYAGISDATITGIVISNVELKEYSKVYKIKVESLNGQTKHRNTYLLMSIKKENNIKIEFGDYIEINGEYVEPSEQRNYGGFNYKEYLKTKKTYGTVNITKVNVKAKRKANTVLMMANDVFLKIKTNIERVFPEKLANLTLAVILGHTDSLDEEIKQNFTDSNMAYILAISGMHISYIISGLIIILKKCFIGKKESKILICLVLIGYMFITGFTPSVMRATIMGILHLGGSIFYRKNDVWTSLCVSLLLILVYNPFLLLSSSVLLSYSGTLGILIFNNKITKFFDRIQIKDMKYKYKINKRFKKIIQFSKSSFVITLSVQIFIIPIYIALFNTVNIGFLFTNLVISIIIGPIIIIGFLAIILSLISIKLLEFVSIFLCPLIELLNLLSMLCKNIPLSKIYVATPPIYIIIGYYFFILFLNFLYGVYNSKFQTAFVFRVRNIISLVKYKTRKNKSKVIVFVLLIFLLVVVLHVLPKNLRIHFIDVGQGDSTLIITPLNKNILIDGGGSENSLFDVGKSILLPYLFDRKLTKIDYIFISHFDEDHVRWTFIFIGRNRG